MEFHTCSNHKGIHVSNSTDYNMTLCYAILQMQLTCSSSLTLTPRPSTSTFLEEECDDGITFSIPVITCSHSDLKLVSISASGIVAILIKQKYMFIMTTFTSKGTEDFRSVTPVKETQHSSSVFIWPTANELHEEQRISTWIVKICVRMA